MNSPSRGRCSNCEMLALTAPQAQTGGLCVPCSRKMPHHTEESRLLADQQLWSEESKRSRSYEPNSEVYYYNRYCWCEKCGAASVFSSLEQRGGGLA
jgi:hypothetical protein